MNRLMMILLILLNGVFAVPNFAHAAGFSHASWDILLKKYVSPVRAGLATQVDYSGLTKVRSQLKQYLSATSSISRAEFDHWSSAEQLAFLINTYNAWTVELVLTGDPNVASIKDLGSFLQSPWKKNFILLFGESRSLDDIEHGLIRGSGRYKDPRIHFAVNCASISCPALRPEAFVAERLEAQLEDSTKLFLSDKTRNRLDVDGFKVSSIFKWYREDFERGWRGTNNLAQFFTRYSQSFGLDNKTSVALSSGNISIEFLDYDWALNVKPRSQP